MNRLRLSGEKSRIDEFLESVKGEESVLDFNRVIPMPESLNIECGSRTDRGLKAYKGFVYVYTFAGTEEKDLLNIPKEKEDAFLRARQDIRRDEWELGKAAFQNERKYGAPTWYEWARQSWGQNGRLTTRKSLRIIRSCSIRLGHGQCPLFRSSRKTSPTFISNTVGLTRIWA